MQRKIIRDYRFWAILICAGLFISLGIINLLKISIPTAKFGALSCAFIYIATALPFIVFFVFAALKLKKSRTLIIVAAMFVLSYIIRIWFADFQSNDYIYFLSKWMAEYRSLGIKECFVQQVGNYSPLYNYFLIAFSRMNIYELYLIKTLSFYFEALTVFFAVKIICFVRKESFNFLWAAIFLLLPIPFTNSSQWAQCDTVYTMCVVAGIYFALKCNCIPAYIFIGLGLAFKMQTVLILPVGLVLLLAKNSDGKKYLLWRYIWIVPLVFFAASSLPVFFGGSFFKVLSVYFNQTTEGNANQPLNGRCANILYPFSSIPDKSVAYYILLVLFIAITAVTDIFIIYRTLKKAGKALDVQTALLLCVLLPLNSVFFMPKMLDRFYYIAEIFLIIYFATYRDKNSFTAYVLLETAQWLVYMRALRKLYALVVAPFFSLGALIIAYAIFFKKLPFENTGKMKGLTSKLNSFATLITESPKEAVDETPSDVPDEPATENNEE
ncbi:MAG: hypothetical protein K2N23_00170 [Clostridia bacterium]|nr:hypothetical protein [Clostridia bacterium]